MWPFYKKELRRAEARRSRVQAEPSFWERFAIPGGMITLLLGLAFAVLATALLLSGEFGPGQAQPPDSSSGLYTLAVGLLVAFLTGAIGVYLAAYRPRVLTNHTRTLSLAILLLLALAVARIFALLNWPLALLLIPGLSVPIILSITYNQRLALGIGWVFSFLVILTTTQLQRLEMGTTGLFSQFAILITALTVAVFSLPEIRSRSKLIEVGIFTGATAGAAVWAMGLISHYGNLAGPDANYHLARNILANSLWTLLAAIIVGLVIQGILPLIERVFRVATSMSLLEWCDANRPLLKRLALEASGTYNHSLQIGTIAELAAEAIGANGLLCRVGCYYHDVGKIAKPAYFVENQQEQSSKHEKLSPEMSSLVILGHVKDGLAIAKEYGLPRVLHQFIEQHHGTTVVEYFYHEARKREPHNKIEESAFRHVGPKPQSPEAGIVMLADTVESAVRSLPEKTAGRIESTVHNLLMKRLMDGQFDQCDLTLRQLHVVEQSLIKSLYGVYHARVPYPESKAPEELSNNAQDKKNQPPSPKPAIQSAASPHDSATEPPKAPAPQPTHYSR